MDARITEMTINLDSSHLDRVPRLELTWLQGKGWRINFEYIGAVGSFPMFIDSAGYSYLGWSLHTKTFKGGDPGNYFDLEQQEMVELALKLTDADIESAVNGSIDRVNPKTVIIFNWKKFKSLTQNLIDGTESVDSVMRQCETQLEPAIDWKMIKERTK